MEPETNGTSDMRVTWRTELPQWTLIAGMFVLAAVSWRAVPSRIPVHWNLSGHPDRYGGRTEGLLLIPFLTLGLYVLLLVAPRLDPGRANYASFRGPYVAIRLTIVTFLTAVDVIVVASGRGRQLQVDVLVPILVGALFIILGGTMGKLRPTWFVGIRTPWTLSSKQSWTKTHRLGGWLFIVLGLIFIASTLAKPAAARAIPLVLTGIALAGLVIYSYLVWRTDPNKLPPAGTQPVEHT